MTDIPATALQIRSLITADHTLELSLDTFDVPTPRDDQVVIRVEAAPINPSDLGLLFGAADMREATVAGTSERPVVTAPVPDGAMAAMSARVGQSLPVGNEGAGVVVAAGSSPEAQALLGATVAAFGGAMYSEYRCVPAALCLRLPDGVTPAEGASCFVNPLTALGMVGTMRLEGHTALVHTAAASNLGQMLNRLCLADGVGLVNIVRKPEQEELLRGQGAQHVCNSSDPSFADDLTDALIATGATLAFDAIGGGDLAGRILSCMETAANASGQAEYNRYGSTIHKQVYIYGGLDRGPTTIHRDFGMAWGIGGWLLMPFLARVGAEEAQRLRDRVAAEITTTFASSYTDEVTLAGALAIDAIRTYGRQATGQKFLVTPHRRA
ncbi:MAG: NADH oxidase [Ilumatobacter sp.]|nr:MAG: NADH oxidase [Ilumatobacter sp.]